MKKIQIILLALLTGLFLIGCAPKAQVAQNGIEVSQAAVKFNAGSGADAAAFMQIKNTAATPDRLVRVSADFGEAQLHETKMEDNVMSMREIPGIDLPAGAMVELRSGSYHIMIIDPRKDLKSGDIVNLTLEFEQAGQINVPVTVGAY